MPPRPPLRAIPSPAATPAEGPAPLVFLTAGDPAGIGPEILLAAWRHPDAHRGARLRACVAPHVLRQAHGGAAVDVVAVAADDPRPSSPERLLVVDPGGTEAVAPGVATAAGGRAAVAALETAYAALRRAEAAGNRAALVTGPLHKAALHAAGHDVPGHTEWLARACGMADDDASMMLWLPADAATGRGALGVVHVTLHESLRTAVAGISSERIVAAGTRLAALLEALLARAPRLAVAALNPHAGEEGLFGDDEARVIAPAVARLRAAGVDAAGPLPADTLFLRAAAGAFDGVVAQYHDQGHIPVKLLGMHRAVNITLGLPLVRTSVAHGTAFDIVGTGRADPASFLAAIDAAVRLAGAGWRGGREAHGRSGKSCGT
jgi:4-hydroxythreonine-4-phosphate dehydrogenase